MFALKRVLCFNFRYSRVLNYRHLGSISSPNFIQNENNFAREVLESLPNYKSTVFTPIIPSSTNIFDAKISWKNLSKDELLSNFKRFSIYASENEISMVDDSCTEMCSAMSRNCEQFSDEELANVLEYMTLWPFMPSVKCQNYYTLWKAIDEACFSRSKNWNVDTILKFVDLFFANRLARQSDFVFVNVTKKARKPSSLTSSQVVQILFYVNILRTAFKGSSMYEIENCLLKHAEELTTNELGVAVMGFFKSQKTLREIKLKEILLYRIMKEADTIPDITLSCLLKILRSSMHFKVFDKIPQVMDILEKQIDRLSLVACAHTCLLTTSSLTYHESSAKKVAQKLVNSITTARLKDMEKVIYVLTLMNINPETNPCIFESVVKEVSKTERLEELKTYPKSFIALMYYLSIRSIFIKPLLEIVLSKEFIKDTYGKTRYSVGREVLFLDSAIELECKDYEGPRLEESLRNYLSKRYSEYLPNPERKLSRHEQFTNDIFKTLGRIYGKKYFTCKYILPHYSRADVVLRIENNTLLEIPDEFKSIEDFTGFIPAPNNSYLALVISGRNNFTTNMNHKLLGDSVARFRYLKKLGYNTAMVSYFDWPTEDSLKDKYLKNIVNQTKFDY